LGRESRVKERGVGHWGGNRVSLAPKDEPKVNSGRHWRGHAGLKKGVMSLFKKGYRGSPEPCSLKHI